jgi:hypothetical protein
MGRSWQFFLTIAIVVAGMSYFYYTSDYYAQRSAGGAAQPVAETGAPVTAEAPAAPSPAPAAPANPAEGGGIIPSNE